MLTIHARLLESQVQVNDEGEERWWTTVQSVQSVDLYVHRGQRGARREKQVFIVEQVPSCHSSDGRNGSAMLFNDFPVDCCWHYQCQRQTTNQTLDIDRGAQFASMETWTAWHPPFTRWTQRGKLMTIWWIRLCRLTSNYPHPSLSRARS